MSWKEKIKSKLIDWGLEKLFGWFLLGIIWLFGGVIITTIKVFFDSEIALKLSLLVGLMIAPVLIVLACRIIYLALSRKRAFSNGYKVILKAGYKPVMTIEGFNPLTEKYNCVWIKDGDFKRKWIKGEVLKEYRPTIPRTGPGTSKSRGW